MGRREIGIVVSDKMDKTVIVRIERLVMHPKYKKYIKKYTKVACHNPGNRAKMGDKVLIEETRPLSKTKHFRVVEILTKTASTTEKLKSGEKNDTEGS